MLPAELTEDSSNTPNLVIIGISLAAFGFLLVNAALVAWFFVHQRRKKGSLTHTLTHIHIYIFIIYFVYFFYLSFRLYIYLLLFCGLSMFCITLNKSKSL